MCNNNNTNLKAGGQEALRNTGLYQAGINRPVEHHNAYQSSQQHQIISTLIQINLLTLLHTVKDTILGLMPKMCCSRTSKTENHLCNRGIFSLHVSQFTDGVSQTLAEYAAAQCIHREVIRSMHKLARNARRKDERKNDIR